MPLALMPIETHPFSITKNRALSCKLRVFGHQNHSLRKIHSTHCNCKENRAQAQTAGTKKQTMYCKLLAVRLLHTANANMVIEKTKQPLPRLGGELFGG